jgi:glucosamine kinase
MTAGKKIYIGIDGGGTKTRAVIGNESGQILGIGLSGPSNIGSAGRECTRRHLREAIQNAAGAMPRPIEINAAFLGMAGIVTEEDRQTIQSLIKNIDGMLLHKTGVHHDIHAALAGGLPGQPGIALIAGTGSSCYGRNGNGQSCQAGGWGHLVDDAGSGYRLAVDGLTAAVRAVDGRGPATALTAYAFDFLQINELPEILCRLHVEGFSGKPLGKDEIANFALAVCSCAQQGDAVAVDIVEHGVDELALMVKTVITNLGMPAEEQTLILAGSVATNPFITTLLKKRLLETRMVPAAFPPIIGALLEAMRLDGLEITESIKTNLQESTKGIITS